MAKAEAASAADAEDAETPAPTVQLETIDPRELVKSTDADPSVVAAKKAYLDSCKELERTIGSLEEAVIAFTGALRLSWLRLTDRCLSLLLCCRAPVSPWVASHVHGCHRTTRAPPQGTKKGSKGKCSQEQKPMCRKSSPSCRRRRERGTRPLSARLPWRDAARAWVVCEGAAPGIEQLVSTA